MLKWMGTVKGFQGLPNIPARDLSSTEVVQYGGEQALLATGLYTKPEPERGSYRAAQSPPERGEIEEGDSDETI